MDHMFYALAKHGRFNISLDVSSNNKLYGVKVAVMLDYSMHVCIEGFGLKRQLVGVGIYWQDLDV